MTPLPIDAVLPQIQAAALGGKLVPFLGAGTSRNLCVGWREFLQNLSISLGLETTKIDETLNSDALYRIADKAAFALRILPNDARRRHLANALLSKESADLAEIPRQAMALVEGYWPLIITTNYDDVLLAAEYAALTVRGLREGAATSAVRLLGRGQRDCETIVRSLDANETRSIWHIQGFVGSVAPQHFGRLDSVSDLVELLNQVVIGHQNYQVATNSNPVFRRTFAEVYRRRSFIFLGSGLSENYFVNLFSEIILTFGPGPRPHFALFSKDELCNIDPEFLQVRLGITPVCYGDSHNDLANIISKIAAPTRHNLRKSPIFIPRPLAMSFEAARPVCPAGLSQGESPDNPAASIMEISLRFRQLDKPQGGACVILSVGLDIGVSGEEVPIVGRMVQGFLRTHYSKYDLNGLYFLPVGDRLFRVYANSERNEKLPIFLLAARETASRDKKSLIAIRDTVQSAVAEIEKSGEFDSIIMGLFGAGPTNYMHPTFPFIAQLSGLRDFLRSAPKSQRPLRLIEIQIVDPKVIGPIVEGRLPVYGLLCSDRTQVLVRVWDSLNQVEAYNVNVSVQDAVSDVLSSYRLGEGELTIDASPLPYHDFINVSRAPVFPTMSIDVRRRP